MKLALSKLVVCGAFAALLTGLLAISATAQRPRQPAVRITNQKTDYQITMAEDAKVRIANPPAKFDDKGNPMRYSADELKKLKGETPEEQKLAGFKSDLDNLHNGDLVSVTISASQPDPKDDKKTTWVPVGQLNGAIANLNGKSFTLHVTTTAVVPSSVRNTGNTNNGKQVVDSEKMQATVVVIVAANPNPPPTKPTNNKSK